MIDTIILQLLILDGNETNLIEEEFSNTSYDEYKDFTLEFIKKRYDVRFCGLGKCACHPEHKLRQYLNNKSLMDFLKWSMGGYFDKMIEIIDNEYESIDIFQSTELRDGVGDAEPYKVD